MNSFPVIYPKPKEMTIKEMLSLPEKMVWKILCPEELSQAEDVAKEMLKKWVPGISFTKGENAHILLELSAKLPHKQPEAYFLHVEEGRIQLNGNSYQGVICGLATLRLLMLHGGKYSGKIPACDITDYPDVRWRAASRWLIDLEGKRMAYDWGDGRKELLRRYREKIDFAMYYKINLAFFEGFSWELAKYPQYISDMQSLNQYAAARNVALEFGGHYIGVGGRNPEFKTAAGCGFMTGLGDLNRYSYPDGEPYKCMGAAEDHPTRYNGTCRSNESLNELKQKQLAEYVRLLEPRALYIHPEDVGNITVLEKDWSLRCPKCREKWPSDVPEEKEGTAGAQAWNLTKLYEAVCSVKNEKSGYDGAKDCLFIVVPIAYAGGRLDEKNFEREVIQYKNIGELMPKSPNILLLMREQFKKCPNGNLRVAEMSSRIPLSTAVFAVNGADGYVGGSLFVAGALLNSFYKGADLIFNFAGTIYQEVQEVFNSECCWNIPELSREVIDKLEKENFIDINCCDLKNIIPDYEERLYAKEGFLPRFCHSFYGEEAGSAVLDIIKMMQWNEYRNGDYPMVSMSYHFDKEHLFDGSFLDLTKKEDPSLLYRHWVNMALLTEKALERLGNKAEKIPDDFTRETMIRFTRVLQLTKIVSSLIRDILKEDKTLFASIRERLAEAKNLLDKYFHFDFISPSDGENAQWKTYLGYLENKLNSMEEK